MLRVIFDTNIYGNLIKEPDAKEIEQRILNELDFKVYGFSLIRKEIRNIATSTEMSRKSRQYLLGLYDRITNKHCLDGSPLIFSIAKKYHQTYIKNSGTYGWDTNIRIDFAIVACASIHGMDIVYSDDRRTLGSRSALISYDITNQKENFRTPQLIYYETLLKKFRGLL